MDGLFEKAQSNASKKLDITTEEAERFKRAFQDPEFCKLMEEYVAEMQNPETRAETESYISQLEGENKVPEGKELIRPEPCFVAKSKKTDKGKPDDKIFINIVQSLKIMPPTKHVSPEGQRWSLPYSLGPPHMECDSHKNNVVTFDCCFHPDATKLCDQNKRYRDMLINTAIEGIEMAYKRQNIITKVSAEYRVLKGFRYKSGQVPTMLVDIASKSTWSAEAISAPPAPQVVPPTAEVVSKEDTAASKQPKNSKSSAVSRVEPVIKKGFLAKAAAKEKSERDVQVPAKTSSLIQEVSSSTAQTVPTTPAQFPIEPQFTMTERGQVSIGDFESVGKQFVGTNRPAEIVYKFELPRVAKSADVQLDVAERVLKLNYPAIYDVSIQLPYPVYDKKGSAKYDKMKKTLTITLPVQPPPMQTLTNDTSAKTIEAVNDKETAIESSINTPLKTHMPKKTAAESHSRWVAQQQAQEDSQHLRDEIQRKAQEAERHFREQATVEVLPLHDDKPKSMIAEATAPPQDLFIKSYIFNGRKQGYVFKNGLNGVGYYLDARSAAQTVEVSAVNPPPSCSNSRTINSVPFEFRQTKQVISIIVNIPDILESTVDFNCSEDGVDIQFEVATNAQKYAIGWAVAAALDASKCTFDVATKNMAIVLTKKVASYVTSSPLLTERAYAVNTGAVKETPNLSSHALPVSEMADMQFSAKVGLFDLD